MRAAGAVRIAGAVLGDALAVVVFVAIGRGAHHHAESLSGLASTAWPFLTGLALGWLAVGWLAVAARASRGRRLGPVQAGLVLWPFTVGVGMGLRVLAGQGTGVAFVFVALAFLGLFLLGWRLAVLALGAVRGRPAQAGAGVEIPTPPRVSEP